MRRDVATRGLALVFTLRLIGCPDDAKIGPPVSGPEFRGGNAQGGHAMQNHRMPFLHLYGSGLNLDFAIVLKFAATCGPFATKRHRVRQKTSCVAICWTF